MKISVITINYNNAIGLKKTIESVLSQTYDKIEYIIIDGNSFPINQRQPFNSTNGTNKALWSNQSTEFLT